MARAGMAVLSVLALSLCVAAQKPQTREPQPDPLVQQLLAQARQATASVPSLLAPGMLSAVARDELGPGRRNQHDTHGEDQPALSDFQAAFALALALPSGTGDPVLDTARAQVKTEVEQEAVAELARHDELDAALQLTRSADVPKAPLYNQLIGAMAEAHDPQGEQKRQDAIAALVDECERLAGAFPYRGVAAWLRRADAPGLDQMLLVQSGYQWAKQETDPSRIQAAVPFLLAGHRKEPELDQELESTIAAQLRSLRTGPLTLTQTSHNAAQGLLTVLRLLDPLQAAQWAQQWPQMNLSGSAEVRSRFGLQLRRRFQLQLPPPADAAAGVDPSGQAAALQQFRKLVHEAESQRHRNPNEALALAGQASGMLDASLWPVALPEAVRVAAIEKELGDTNDAAALLESCLDEADRQARSDDAAYLNGDPDALAGLAQDPSRAGAAVLEAYSEAARVDFAATAAHAESAQFTLLRPLVLARVALVGAIAARRAARETEPH